MKNLWLPKGYDLPDGSKIGPLRYFGEEWQIFDTNASNNILLVKPELTKKWINGSFLEESLFGTITFGAETFLYLFSNKDYVIAPVENGYLPKSKADALAFALALKESRKLSKDVSFHDAVYVEQYSKLLPAYTLTPRVDDDVVLGYWITGGVVISTESFRRLANLTGWMPASDLADIIKTAGFSVTADAGLLLTKRKPLSQSETKTATVKDVVEPDRPQTENTSNIKQFKLPGRPHLEEFFNEHVIDIIFNAEKYQTLGINFPSAIVLHGPPGCGKTFAVERLVEFIDWPSYSIDSGSVGSPYIHETGKKISEVFNKAIDNAPSIIIIDEMESFLSDRNFGGSSGLHHVEEVAEFLRRIPEAIKNKVLIIAMTNQIDMIDPAILRRGRFDHVIKVEMPSKEEVSSLIESLLSKLPKAADLNLDKVINELTGKPLSDSAFAIREAARLAAKAGKSLLDQKSIEIALDTLSNGREKGKHMGFKWEKQSENE